MSTEAGILIIGRFIAFLLNFVLPIVLVRIFEKGQFGIYRQLILIHITFLPILQLGVAQSLYYFFPREELKRKTLIQQSFIFLLLIGIVFFFCILIFKNVLATWLFHNLQMVAILPMVGLFTSLMLPTSILEILLIVEKRVKLASLVTALSAAFRLLSVLLFAFLFKSVQFLIIALVIFAGVRFAFLIGYMLKKYRVNFGKIDFGFLKRELIYAIPFGFAVIMVTLNKTIDKFIVSNLFSSSNYAIYSIGCYQIPIITITFNAVLNIILPKISLLQKENKPFEIMKLWHRAMRKLALLGFPVFAFFMAFSTEFIIALFTDKYVESVPIFRAILFIILVDTTIYGVIVRAYGKTPFVFMSSVIAFVISIACIYPAIKILGLKGGAIVIVFSHALLAVFQIVKSKILLKANFSNLLPWGALAKILVVALLCAGILIPLKFVNFLSELPIFLMSSIIFFTLYIILIWNIPILTKQEKVQCRRYVSRIYLGRVKKTNHAG